MFKDDQTNGTPKRPSFEDYQKAVSQLGKEKEPEQATRKNPFLKALTEPDQETETDFQAPEEAKSTISTPQRPGLDNSPKWTKESLDYANPKEGVGMQSFKMANKLAEGPKINTGQKKGDMAPEGPRDPLVYQDQAKDVETPIDSFRKQNPLIGRTGMPKGSEPKQEAASYTFRGQQIDQTRAKDIIAKAQTMDDIEGLSINNDSTLMDALNQRLAGANQYKAKTPEEMTPEERKVGIFSSYLNIFSSRIANTPADLGEGWAIASAAMERGLAKIGIPGANPEAKASNVWSYKVSEDWRKYMDEVYPTEQKDRETFVGGVVDGLGQIVPMVLTAGVGSAANASKVVLQATKTGSTVTPYLSAGKEIVKGFGSPEGLIAGTQIASASYKDAIANGATEEQALQYGIENFAVGSVIERLPVQSLFKRIKDLKPDAKILDIIKEGLVGFTEEAVTEMWQELYGNMSAQRIYDTTKDLLDGVGEAGAIGGTIGLILNTLGAALTGRRARVTSPEERQAIDQAVTAVTQRIEQVNQNNQTIQANVNLIETASRLGEGLGPNSFGNDTEANRTRRQQADKVIIAQTKNGESLEIVGESETLDNGDIIYNAVKANGIETRINENVITDFSELTFEEFNGLLEGKLDNQSEIESDLNQELANDAAEQIEQVRSQYQPYSFTDPMGNTSIVTGTLNGEQVFVTQTVDQGFAIVLPDGTKKIVSRNAVQNIQTLPFDQFIDSMVPATGETKAPFDPANPIQIGEQVDFQGEAWKVTGIDTDNGNVQLELADGEGVVFETVPLDVFQQLRTPQAPKEAQTVSTAQDRTPQEPATKRLRNLFQGRNESNNSKGQTGDQNGTGTQLPVTEDGGKESGNKGPNVEIQGLIGQQVRYKGRTGTLQQAENGQFEIISGNRIIELPSEVQGSSLSGDLGIEQVQQPERKQQPEKPKNKPGSIQFSANERTVDVDGRKYTVNLNELGNIASLSYTNEQGEKRTSRDEALILAVEIERNKSAYFNNPAANKVQDLKTEIANDQDNDADSAIIEQVDRILSLNMTGQVEAVLDGDSQEEGALLQAKLWIEDAIQRIENYQEQSQLKDNQYLNNLKDNLYEALENLTRDIQGTNDDQQPTGAKPGEGIAEGQPEGEVKPDTDEKRDQDGKGEVNPKNTLRDITYTLANPERNELVYVPVDALLQEMAKDPEYDVQNPANQIGNRVQKAIQFLRSYLDNQNMLNPRTGERMNSKVGFEASRVYVNNGKIGFEDGRHRVLAAKELGLKEIGIEVPKAQAEQIRTILGVSDKENSPEANRKRGYFIDGTGNRVDRSAPLKVQEGKAESIKFSDKVSENGFYTVIDAKDLNPSHNDGLRNPKHFIPEAQPKDRRDQSSLAGVQNIANNLNPREVAVSTNAYTGSPVVNTRGEVIQGNNRSNALKTYWKQEGTQDSKGYKQYLIENAAEFGLDPAAIEGMENPVLVRMVRSADPRSIELGNYDAKDIETGGGRRIDAKQTLGKLNKAARTALLTMISEGQGKTPSEIIREKYSKILDILYKANAINSTQLQAVVNDQNEITKSGVEDLTNLFMEFLFEGGSPDLQRAFTGLPAKVQNGIEKALPNILRAKNPIVSEIQNAILALSQFQEFSGNFAEWLTQINAFAPNPVEVFGVLPIEIARKFDTLNQNAISELFNEYYRLTSDVPGDMFNDGKPGIPQSEAIEQIFNVKNYDPKINGSGEAILDPKRNNGNTSNEGDKGGNRPGEKDGTSTKVGGIGDIFGTDNKPESPTDKPGTKSKPTGGKGADNVPGRNIKDIGDVLKPKPEPTPEEKQALLDKAEKLREKQEKERKKQELKDKLEQRKRDRENVPTGEVKPDGKNLDEPKSGETKNSKPTDYGNGNKVFTKSDAEKAREELRNFLKGKGGKLLTITDPEVIMAGIRLAGYHIEAGARKYGEYAKAMIEDIGEGIVPYLRQFYESIRWDPQSTSAGLDKELSTAEEIAETDIKAIIEQVRQEENVSNQPGDSQPDSEGGANEVQGDESTIPGDRGNSRNDGGKDAEGSNEGNKGQSGIKGINDVLPDNGGKPGDNKVPGKKPIRDNGGKEPGTGNVDGRGNSIDGAEGSNVDGRTDNDIDPGTKKEIAKFGKGLDQKREAQKKAESIPNKRADLDNIRETLPYLLPEQQEDVLKAETRFYGEEHQGPENANGKGILFTNGTGTGKTYTGLGIIKRALKDGKKNILIITPSQTKVSDWIDDGKNLGIDVRRLDNTKDNGGTHPVMMTSFANFRDNPSLYSRDWDLIVYDESHRIMESKEAKVTSTTQAHFKNANVSEFWALERLKDETGLWKKERELLDSILEWNKQLLDAPNRTDLAQSISKAESELATIKAKQNNILPGLKDRASKSVQNTKVVFLSATPFKAHFNLDYALDVLLPLPKEGMKIGFSRVDPRSKFYLDNFGSAYEWKFHRLQGKTDANPAAIAMQETEFAEKMMKNGLMSGRAIDSDKDYARHFPLVTGFNSEIFNEAVGEIFNYQTNEFDMLRDAARDMFYEYNYTTQLLESMKASASIDRIEKHIALGRKVVVFHRRKQANITPPFHYILQFALNNANAIREGVKAGIVQKTELQTADMMEEQANSFKQKYSGLLKYELTLDYRSAVEQFQSHFGERVAFFNGDISDKKKAKAVSDFNDDNSKVQVIVIQEESGKEGISLHDTTGKHQRVLMSLSMPISSITALQVEGRIYRIGNQSNAIMEYPLLGLDTELAHFGQTLSKRVSTTENLAMGKQSRDLLKSFAMGVLNSVAEDPNVNQGIGGKGYDRRVSDGLSEFQKAKLYYDSNQKIKGSRDQREGMDYFPTPEPVGQKMMSWLGLKPSQIVLEPSAGKGSIAMWAPGDVNLTAIEPSMDLFAKLSAATTGGDNRNIRFEDLNIVNKYDGVVMNPPFGSGGKLAMEHLEKAFKHVRDGGRVIALLPSGPSMDKRIEKFFDSENKDNKGIYLRAEISLPSVAFKQAGTGVNTKIYVFDKVSKPADPNADLGTVMRADLRRVESVGEMFDALEFMEVPSKVEIQPKVKMENSIQEITDKIFSNTDGDSAGTEAIVPANSLRYELGKHTKTGADLHLVKLNSRVEKDIYNRLVSLAKNFDKGYFNKFADGYLFTSEALAKAFMNKATGQGTDPEIHELRTPFYSSKPSGKPVTDQGKHVRAEVEKIAGNWQNGPKIEVYDNVSDVYEAYPDKNFPDLNDTAAFFMNNADGNGGQKIIIIANHPFNSKASGVKQAVLHEAIGHYGIRGFIRSLAGTKNREFQAEFNAIMQRIFDAKSNDPEVRRIARVYFGKDVADLNQQQIYDVAEEYLAHQAQTGVTATWLDRAVSEIMGLLRKLGFDLKMTDMEMLTIIANGTRFVETGQGPRVKENISVSSMPVPSVVMPLYIGPKASISAEMKDALQGAKKLYKEGASMERIVRETGWFKDAKDGSWKYEIDDFDSYFKGFTTGNRIAAFFGSGTVNLSTIFEHPALFRAYPELRKMQVEFIHKDGATPGGKYENGSNTITIRVDKNNPTDVKFALLHEIQHAIQENEGFAQGGTQALFDRDMKIGAIAYRIQMLAENMDLGQLQDLIRLDREAAVKWFEANTGTTPMAREIIREVLDILVNTPVKTIRDVLYNDRISPFDKYQALAGEVESRNVTDRMKLNAAERSDRMPWADDEYGADQVIISKSRAKISKELTLQGPLLAPNGKPSKLTPEQYRQVRTPEFKAWFGDWETDPANASKVLDVNGEPMPMYHGSPSVGITEFDSSRSQRKSSGLREVATYFTSNRTLAEMYRKTGLKDSYKAEIEAEIEKLKEQRNNTRSNWTWNAIQAEIEAKEAILEGKVYEVFLNVRTPMEFDGEGLDERAWRKLSLNVGYKTATGKADVMDALTGNNGAYTNDTYDGVIGENLADMFSGQAMFTSDPQAIEKLKTDVKKFSGKVVAVWNPTQIKSATDNQGTFDGSNPDIRALNVNDPDQEVRRIKTAVEKARERWLNFREKYQDNMIRAKKLIAQKRGLDKVTDSSNFYIRENLSKGKTLVQTERFMKDLYDPLIKTGQEMNNKFGVTLDEIGDYLMSLHAPERNARIKAENPNIDFDPSGISDQEAEKIKAEFEAKVTDTDMLEQLVDQVRAINEFVNYKRFESGMISEDTYNQLTEMYENYVPLRGFEDFSAEDLSVYSPLKKAMGRKSKAFNPIPFMVTAAQEAIMKGENNKVRQSLLEFVKENPSAGDYQIRNAWYIKTGEVDETGEDVWIETMKRPTKSQLDSGEAMRSFNPDVHKSVLVGGQNNHIVPVFVNGRRVFIEFQNPAIPMAIKNMSVTQTNSFMNRLRAYTRWLSSMYTQYSPEFGLRNLFRDMGFGTFNIISENDPATAAKTLKELPKSTATLAKFFLEGDYGTGQDMAMLKEFMDEGALTGYSDLRSIKDIFASAQKEIDNINRKGIGAILDMGAKGLDKALKPLDVYNRSLENSMRFAYYKTLRSQGVSKMKAAAAAKDLTVNFNRKGNDTSFWGSVYIFFNASVQGSERLIRNFKDPRTMKKAAGLAGGLMAAGLSQALILGMFGGDDEDGEKLYAKIPDYVRRTHLIIPILGTNEFLKLPLPYGVNIFYAMGESLGSVIGHGKNPGKEAMGLMTSLTDSFSPIGGYEFDSDDLNFAQKLMKLLAPSVLQPIADLAVNRDFKGARIYREPFTRGQLKEPNSQSYFPGVSGYIKAVTSGLNSLTGGDDVQAGWIDINPEWIEHGVENYLGGPISFAKNITSTAMGLLQGENVLDDPNYKKIPFVRNYRMKVSSSYQSQQQFYEHLDLIGKAASTFEKYREKDSPKAEDYFRENKALIRMEDQATKYRKIVKEMNKAINHYSAMDKTPETEAKLDQLKEKRTEVYVDFNRNFKKTTKNEGEKVTGITDLF